MIKAWVFIGIALLVIAGCSLNSGTGQKGMDGDVWVQMSTDWAYNQVQEGMTYNDVWVAIWKPDYAESYENGTEEWRYLTVPDELILTFEEGVLVNKDIR